MIAVTTAARAADGDGGGDSANDNCRPSRRTSRRQPFQRRLRRCPRCRRYCRPGVPGPGASIVLRKIEKRKPLSSINNKNYVFRRRSRERMIETDKGGQQSLFFSTTHFFIIF